MNERRLTPEAEAALRGEQSKPARIGKVTISPALEEAIRAIVRDEMKRAAEER